MRISNLHHETAVDQLFYLQEIEPDTWDALQKRLSGINQARHMNRKDMFTVKNLPFMFKDWKEYRNYLLENLVDEKYKPQFRKKFQGLDDKFINMVEELKPEMYRECIFSILSNDYEFVKIANFLGRPHTMNYLKFMRGKDINWNRPEKDLKYIKPEFRGRKVIVGATDGV
jgi:predicted phosphoadenosine phosphosulfate sulfurtransferase